MFEYLKAYNRIIVTGPQRSGTRICAKMIAYDTGMAYIDEAEIAVDSTHRMAQILFNQGIVLQAPGMCHCVHYFGKNENLLVVMVFRDINDIIRSQERIDWKYEAIERIKYGGKLGPIAKLKYEFWEKQKPLIHHWVEVEYESLKEHPLWVPKEKREGFGDTQTCLSTK
jgi:hypothetical protein